MKLLSHAVEGLQNLYHARLRSLLALLGVLVGTASVVAMVLGGDLATAEALKQFKSLGTDLLALTISAANSDHPNTVGKIENLSVQQALSLPKADPAILQAAPYTQFFLPIYYQGHSINAMVLGVTDSFVDVIHMQMKSGRAVSLLDNYTFYCTIGQHVYQLIKEYSFKEPLGQQLQIGNNIFVIIGIANTWPENNFVYANIDDAVVLPIMASMVVSKYAAINNIILRLSPSADIAAIQKNISNYMTHSHINKQITFRSAKELIARMKKQSEILTLFLGLIGSISLMVGGIGVMNIMLVSVIERRREIGIRLAVGAKRRDIGLLFLMEAIMLSLVGGLAGVFLGVLIAYFITLFWHWEFTLFLWPPLVGFTVSVIVGIFFGSYPAFRAAKLDPIEALRAE
ncbi:MAG: ABC transporter permease [Gammaproteobacteria bacterium]|nr:ABC transporter permease [Gammaproteobacteria bacterium]